MVNGLYGFSFNCNPRVFFTVVRIAAAANYRIRLAFRIISLAADDPEHCSTNYIEIIDETLGKSQGRICGRKTSGDIVSQGMILTSCRLHCFQFRNEYNFSI